MTKKNLINFFLCISVALMTLMTGMEAKACRIAIKPLKERVSESDLIILGNITEAKKLKRPSGKMDHEAMVMVDEVLKGNVKIGDSLKMYFLLKGWDKCKPGTQHFSAGKRKKKLKELFFLRKIDDGYLTSAEFTGGHVEFYDTKEYLKQLSELLKKGT